MPRCLTALSPQFFAVLMLLSTCASPPNLCAGTSAVSGITAQFFFGRSLKSGASISDAVWTSFLADTVTPRFPDGLTVLEAAGQWRQRSSGRIISEHSTIIEIATDRSPETIAKFEAIRTEYKRRFQQESVGLVINESCASF